MVHPNQNLEEQIKILETRSTQVQIALKDGLDSLQGRLHHLDAKSSTSDIFIQKTTRICGRS
jgi:hypothetical protein